MKKLQQYHFSLLATSRIKGIDKYNQIFLATMLLRGIRHPEEGLTEIVQKASKTMEKRYSNHPLASETDEKMRQASIEAVSQTETSYGKNNILVVSLDKIFDNLESSLEQAKFPIGFQFSGEQTVKSVFDYLMKNVRIVMEIGSIKELSDAEIVFLVDLYEEQLQKSGGDLLENIKSVIEGNGDTKNPKTQKEDIEVALKGSNIPKEWQINFRSNILQGVLDHLATITS